MGSAAFKSRRPKAYHVSKRKSKNSGFKSLQRKLSDLASGEPSNDSEDIDFLTNKIAHACSWQEDLANVSELHENIVELFAEVETEIIRLSKENRSKAVARIVHSVDKLKNSLGDNLLKECGLNSFLREVIYYKTYEVSVVQYFKPEPFYKNVWSLLKLFAFVVNEVDIPESIFTYYLEYSNIVGDYHVLGLWSEKGHAQLVAFGESPPKYSNVRTSVLNDLERRGRCTEIEYNSLIATLRN